MTEASTLPNARPYDLITESIEDLLVEARNYADGSGVETQAQADDVSRIIDGLNKHAKALDEARVQEKKPLDDAVKAIQDRYGDWIADRKNKKPGKVWKAVDALKATLAPYLQKLDDEKRAREAAARAEAEAARLAAEKAMQAARHSDLEAKEAAEAVVEAAEQAERAAKAASKDKAHATGGSRAMGLRSVWKAELENEREAARHFWDTNPEAFTALLQKLADDQVRAGKRSGIPGVRIWEDKVL